jgi:hypothetical protein
LKVGKSSTIDIFARERWNGTGLFLAEGAKYEFPPRAGGSTPASSAGPGGTADNNFQIGKVAHLAGSAWGGCGNAIS